MSEVPPKKESGLDGLTGFLGSIREQLTNFSSFFEHIKDSTRSMFDGFASSLGLDTGAASQKEGESQSSEGTPELERVRRVIDAQTTNMPFRNVAEPAWRTISSMPDADLNGVARYDLWLYMMALAEQESGYKPSVKNTSSGAFGLFQIMPANFASWGLTSGAGAGIEEQVKVAAKQLTGYFSTFKRWDAVSVAWFGGASRAVKFVKSEQSVGNLADSGGKTIASYHANVEQKIDKLKKAAEA